MPITNYSFVISFKDVIDDTCSIVHIGVQQASVTALGSRCNWTNMVFLRKEDSDKIGCTGNIKTRSCFGWHLAAISSNAKKRSNNDDDDDDDNNNNNNNNNNTRLKCLSIDKVGGIYLRTSNTEEAVENETKRRDELFVSLFPEDLSGFRVPFKEISSARESGESVH